MLGQESDSPDGDVPKDDEVEECMKSIQLDEELEEKLKEVPGALDYIEQLRMLIKKHIKKIRKLRKKIACKGMKDVATQTDLDAGYKTEIKGMLDDVKLEEKSLAEDIVEAAEQAVQNSGFVYEETSGMYYDYNTGYYYNAEYGLYYDGNTGTYMSYNQEAQTYEFHSQVTIPETQKSTAKKKKDTHKRKKIGDATKDGGKRCKTDLTDSHEDVEEGECSESDNQIEQSESESEHETDSSEMAKAAPCMRVIVEESDVPSMKVGSLYIITRDGGTLGREGSHSIVIKDMNTSKHHLKFTYDDKGASYFVTDLGSRNGTRLNGKRMSPSKQESESMKVQHGSKIQIGSTVLLCHIHDGVQTCGHCEPGLLQEKAADEVRPRVSIRYNRAERHKIELMNLKKMCGVVTYEDDSKLGDGYTDRAQKRRDTVGSQNPHEKTQVASVDESIPKENKGFKLLQKMGWKEGESLGKENEGITEPIKVEGNEGTTGLGADEKVDSPDSPVPIGKKEMWMKARERFEKLPETLDLFEQPNQVQSSNKKKEEKVTPTSYNPIPKENKGFRLLQKLGWNEGQSLGKENDGIKEPIQPVANVGNTGIGGSTSLPKKKNKKPTVFVKAKDGLYVGPDVEVSAPSTSRNKPMAWVKSEEDCKMSQSQVIADFEDNVSLRVKSNESVQVFLEDSSTVKINEVIKDVDEVGNGEVPVNEVASQCSVTKTEDVIQQPSERNEN